MGRMAHSTEQVDLIEHLNAAIARLASEVKDAASYLPTYDQRTYAEAVKALREKLEETRAQYAPRPKFAFKTARKNPSAVSLSDAAELAAQKRQGLPGYLSPGSSVESSIAPTPNHFSTPPPEDGSVPPVPPPTAAENTRPFPDITQLSGKAEKEELRSDPQRPQLQSSDTTIAISNQSEAHIILPSSSSHASTPCHLVKIEKCVVDLSVPTSSGLPFASLTMKGVRKSLLLCGKVDGPAHVTGVENSVLVLECRQLRMHDCNNVDVYLQCSSRPIIEDCVGVRFAQLPQAYVSTVGDLTVHADASQQSGQASTQNMWDQVDDFKWLKAEHSPNWSILPPEDAVPDEVWSEIVPGGPGWSLTDILRATKVPS
jgi:hypothetical protein